MRLEPEDVVPLEEFTPEEFASWILDAIDYSVNRTESLRLFLPLWELLSGGDSTTREIAAIYYAFVKFREKMNQTHPDFSK